MKVQAKDLSYVIDGSALVKEVTMELPSGSTTAVIGPNGSGKSTLLHLLAGDLAPTSGTVLYDSEPLSAISIQRRARIRGFLEAQREPEIAFTVEQVVAMGRYPHRFDPNIHSATNDQAVESAIHDFDLGALRTRQVRSLSGGEQQRVAIARVFAQESHLVLLDEPTNAVDIGHQATVMAHIERLPSQGRTVVAVLHDLDMAAYFDNVLLMFKGSVVASGTPDQVLTSADLTRAYGHPIDVEAHPRFDGLLILPRRIDPPSRG